MRKTPQLAVPTHLEVEIVVVDVRDTFVNHGAGYHVPVPGGVLSVRGPQTDTAPFSAGDNGKRGFIRRFGRNLSECSLQLRQLHGEDLRVLALVRWE